MKPYILFSLIVFFIHDTISQTTFTGVSRTSGNATVVNLSTVVCSATLNSTNTVRREIDLPTGSMVKTMNSQTQLPSVPTTFVNSALSPNPSTSFAGTGKSGIPPDVNGAVGLNHVMITINSQIVVQNKTGTNLLSVPLQNLWCSIIPRPTNLIFDPRIMYDPYSNRWMVSACSGDDSNTSALLLSVSQTSDPTGNWNSYSFDTDFTNSNNTYWVDNQRMGFNKDWITIAGNLVPNGGSFYTGSQLYVFNKSNLYGGNNVNFTTFLDPTANNLIQTPAETFDNNLSIHYVITRGSSYNNGLLYPTINIYTITGTVNAPIFTNTNSSIISGISDFGGGSASQLGSTNRIGAGDGRLSNLVYRNGSLWTTHDIIRTNPTRASVMWWQISPNATLIQNGVIDDNTGINNYIFPSIGVNSQNDVLVGFTRTSSNQYPSANYSFRSSTDPVNTMQSDIVFKAGTGAHICNSTMGSTESCRWGDYTSTIVDPSNDFDMWTVQEYAQSGSANYGLWWAKITPTCPITQTLTASISSGTQTFRASNNITSTSNISGSSTNVIYRAGLQIVLNQGFKVSSGAIFRGRIGDCTSNSNRESNNLTTLDVNEEIKGVELSAYPNPTSNGEVIIQYTLPEDGNASINLANMNGLNVRSIVEERFHEKGTYKIKASVSDLKTGIYLYILQGDKVRLAKKLVIE